MKTRSSLDFDGLDGILPTQNTGYQKHQWAKRLWWLLPIPVAVAAIYLSTKDSRITPPKMATPTTQIVSTHETAPIFSHENPQTTTDDHQADNRTHREELARQSVKKSPDAQQANGIEAKPASTSTATTNPKTLATLYSIYFNLDSSKLSLMTPPEIDAIVAAAKRCPRKINLTGHTCNMGSAHINKALGLTRAKRVKKLLSNNGIEPKLIITLSNGMDNPVASNDTREGRKLNRRVDLTCLDH